MSALGTTFSFVYIMFQNKLSEEFSSLQVTVSQLKCKLESCHEKLEAVKRELQEKECEAVEYCNMLQVTLHLLLLSFTVAL